MTTDRDVPAATHRPVPLLLLDVDGVLNALADEGVCRRVWPDWRSGWATADGARWPIRWSPQVVEALRGWQAEGRVELQWLTTWGHDANVELRQLLGLPRLPVAGTYDDTDREAGAPEVGAGRSHAAVAPAAPDPLSGRWWKYDVVRRVLQEHPGRRVLWVDDELHDRGMPFRRWAEEHADLVPVGPDPVCGLSPTDLHVLSEALRA
jgi:hypothetical protein